MRRHLKVKHLEAHKQMKLLNEKSNQAWNRLHDDVNVPTDERGNGSEYEVVGENTADTVIPSAEELKYEVLQEVVETQSDELSETITYFVDTSKVNDEETDNNKDTKMKIVDKSQGPKQHTEGVRKRSWLWNYFVDLGDPLVRCKICYKTLRGNKARHMRSKHPKTLKQMKNRIKKASENMDVLHDKNVEMSQSADLQKCVLTTGENTIIVIQTQGESEDGVIQEIVQAPEDEFSGTIEYLDESSKLSDHEEDKELAKSTKEKHFVTRNQEIQSGVQEKDTEGEVDDEMAAETLEDFEGSSNINEGRLEKPTRISSVENESFAWVIKYANKVSPDTHECDVCKQVIYTQGGIIKKMAHHFKIRHPYIVATSTSTQKAKSSVAKFGCKARSWVRKYITALGGKAHRCNICHLVLHMKLMGNMRRHFRIKHTAIFDKEEKV